mmetsp:Transcript_97418/g.231790  ORF Transcript_97418/g.231790 Transcript_97418/m.231790 type:complete len:130 (-) Transcript_97418:704-1093(-)
MAQRAFRDETPPGAPFGTPRSNCSRPRTSGHEKNGLLVDFTGNGSQTKKTGQRWSGQSQSARMTGRQAQITGDGLEIVNSIKAPASANWWLVSRLLFAVSSKNLSTSKNIVGCIPMLILILPVLSIVSQ